MIDRGTNRDAGCCPRLILIGYLADSSQCSVSVKDVDRGQVLLLLVCPLASHLPKSNAGVQTESSVLNSSDISYLNLRRSDSTSGFYFSALTEDTIGFESLFNRGRCDKVLAIF